MQMLGESVRSVGLNQFLRKHYWILKYIEKKSDKKEEAIVLEKRRHNYAILLPAYMMECKLPISVAPGLKPNDFIHVTIQYVNAKNKLLSVRL